MAITIETIAKPGATPIARGTASQKSFDNDYAKLAKLSMQAQKAILIEGLIYAVNNVSAVDYRSAHANLVTDAARYTGGISQLNLITALTALVWSHGKALDATLSADVEAMIKNEKDIWTLPEETQDRIIAVLLAQLG